MASCEDDMCSRNNARGDHLARPRTFLASTGLRRKAVSRLSPGGRLKAETSLEWSVIQIKLWEHFDIPVFLKHGAGNYTGCFRLLWLCPSSFYISLRAISVMDKVCTFFLTPILFYDFLVAQRLLCDPIQRWFFDSKLTRIWHGSPIPKRKTDTKPLPKLCLSYVQ